VVIQGKVDGSISGSDRVELRKSGVLVGDIVTQRIIIEDGAYFKGGIDIRKDNNQGPKREQSSASSSTSTPVTAVSSSPSSPLSSETVSSTRG
jgi:cytoskeletal protein CcmA (bactofilin family)